MSYYDDFGHPPRRSRSGGFFQGFIGAIIGGLLVLGMLPVLDDWGFSPYRDNHNANQNEPIEDQRQGDMNHAPVQTVNVDVNTNVSEAVAKVESSVVGVVNLQRDEDFWTRNPQVVQAGTGSGVIIGKKNGEVQIVTNYHVIEGASEVEVVLANGERVKAEIRGSDPLTDLAVLVIDDKQVEANPVQFGNSDTLKPGEPAIAIGNPLGLEFSRTVTVGVISSTERSIPQDLDGDGTTDWEMDVIQTDAAINPGNSGGALINIAGQLVGINSAKISQLGIEGMGFAIPINDARPIIDRLLKEGRINRPVIGIQPKNLQEVDSYHWQNTLFLPEEVHAGVVVIGITPRGPAEAAGLKELDVIVKIDDEEIKDSADLRKYLYTKKNIGDQVKVTFYREGKLQSVTVTLAGQGLLG